jgi:hypothetical protein
MALILHKFPIGLLKRLSAINLLEYLVYLEIKFSMNLLAKSQALKKILDWFFRKG